MAHCRKGKLSNLLPNADSNLLEQAFDECIESIKEKQLNILVTGKTGVGKSRLVNALVGRRVAEEGRTKDLCTIGVNPYSVVIEGIEVFVWDSRGLQDGTNNEELHLRDLQRKNDEHGFDVFIYCLKMDDSRFYSEDKNAIRKLTARFGPQKLWKSAVVALTFANRIEDPDDGDEREYFSRELSEWRKAINDILTELRVDPQTRSALSIVPAGNYKKLQLPNCENWLSELWVCCYCAMSDSAGIALYLINKHRLTTAAAANTRPAESDSTQGADAGCDLGDIPREIVLNEEQQDRVVRRMWQAFVAWLGARANEVKQLFTAFRHWFQTRLFRRAR